MAIYKPYPKYKNSNIPWLGEIPEHWEITKLKYLITLQKGKVPKEFSNKENNLPYLSMEYLRGKLTIPSYVLPQENLIEVENDELLILWDGANAGEVMKSKKGVLSSTMAVIRINENYFDERFFFHFLKWLEKELKTFANGTTIPHLDSSVLIDNHYCIPLFEEQTAIARFLDYKLAKINRFIQKKKQLIKLLNEQKAAIINQAVTKGLDPNAKMKDSGIEWLGEIPASWEPTPLKYLLKPNGIIRGPFGSALRTDFFVKKGYKVYEQKNAIYKDLSLGTSYIDLKKFTELKRFEVLDGDFLMSCSGTIGKLHKVEGSFEKGIINQAMMILRIKENILKSDYFHWLFESEYIKSGILDNSKGSAMKNLVGINEFKALVIPLPNINDQVAIVNHLNKETLVINTTISKIEKEIALVEEYKTALIAEAVTGKIDVRGYEVPEVTEEETYEEIEDPDSYRDSMAAEDAAEYENESDL